MKLIKKISLLSISLFPLLVGYSCSTHEKIINNSLYIKELKVEEENQNSVSFTVTFNNNVKFNKLEIHYKNLNNNSINSQQIIFTQNKKEFTFNLKNLEANTEYQILSFSSQEALTQELKISQKIKFKTKSNFITKITSLKQVETTDSSKLKIIYRTNNELNLNEYNKVKITYSLPNQNNKKMNQIIKTSLNNELILDAEINTKYIINKIETLNLETLWEGRDYSEEFQNLLIINNHYYNPQKNELTINFDTKYLNLTKHKVKTTFKSINSNHSFEQIFNFKQSSTINLNNFNETNKEFVLEEMFIEEKGKWIKINNFSNEKIEISKNSFSYLDNYFSPNNVISDTYANINLYLSDLNNQFSHNQNIKLTLSNLHQYSSNLQYDDIRKQYYLNINFRDLNPKEKYHILKIELNKQLIYDYNTSKTYFKFTTLDNIEDITSFEIEKNILENDDTNNEVSISFNQIKPEYINKKMRLSFINENNKIFYSDDIFIKNQNKEFRFILNNLKPGHKYSFYKIELYNDDIWKQLNIKNNINKYFIINEKQHNQEIEEKVHINNAGIFDLQNANTLSNNEININKYNDEILSQETLKKNNHFNEYFKALEEDFDKNTSNDTINYKNYQMVQNIDIENIKIQDQKVRVQLSNLNINILNSKVLVKSYDEHNPWSKLIETSVSDNALEFNLDILPDNLNQFIITNLIFNTDKLIKLDFSSKYIIKIKTQIDFNISHFKVYKDNINKDLYGSISFNWNENEAKKLKDKIFVLIFKTQKKEFNPKYDIFGQITNQNENFDEKNILNDIKKVYLNFEELHKFKMNNFQEKLIYNLNSFDILNKGSYTNFLERQKVNLKYNFSFDFNWEQGNPLTNQLHTNYKNISQQNEEFYNSLKITKRDLFNNEKSQQTNINYSISNFENLLEYNFENYYKRIRNPYKQYKQNKKYKIFKNGIEQSINWFRSRDLLAKSVFNINKEKTKAYLSKNLNSIIGLNSINDEDVIFWFIFELDLNPVKINPIKEFDTPFSRVIVPISLKNIRQNRNIQNAMFYLDYKVENVEMRNSIANKISSNVKFDISLGQDNVLKLSINSRNNAKINNLPWIHNNSNERSIYINNSQFIVNWIQDKNIDTPKLSYLESESLDNNTIHSTSVISKNTYETINTIEENSQAQRLFKSNLSRGINEARSRAFSLNSLSDGTWNVIAKVNNDPNDYHFWISANYHVWNTRRQDPNWEKTITREGYEEIISKSPELVSPTLIENSDSLTIEPIYRRQESFPNIEANGNLYKVEFSKQNPIKYKLFLNFKDNINNSGVSNFINNIGEIESADKDNVLDIAFVIADFSYIFKQFENIDLDNYRKQDGSLLLKKEKESIRHFLNFKKLKTLQKSKLSFYANSDSNLNLYIGSIPKGYTRNKYGNVQASRYREYIYGNNSRPIGVTVGNDMDAYVFESDVQYTDLANGSSGSIVYDHEGKLFGMNVQGNATAYNSFLILDNLKNSYYGSKETIYNPYTFYSKIKKLNYLYPETYSDIFED